VYWNPWAPVFYESYWGYNRHYYADVYYHRSVEVRSTVYYSNYVSRRNYSTIVVENNRRNVYRETYNGHQYRNFGDENHHENGTPRNTNNTHDTNPRGIENSNHENNASPRGTVNNTNSPKLNGAPNEPNTIANPRIVSPRQNQENLPISPKPAVTPRQNQENNDTPRSIETPRHNQENTISSPRPMNTRPNNSNENMPRNNTQTPKGMNSTPRSNTPKLPKTSIEGKNENREGGRR
jgi:hypothetical protein